MAFYPHGSIEMEGGNLVSVENFGYDLDNSAVQETTMHSAGAGFSFGQVKATGEFMVKQSTAEERDFHGKVVNKLITSLTFKTPAGKRIPINCAMGKISVKDQEQGASTATISWVGYVPKSAFPA